MPYNPDGTFSLLNEFGSGTPLDNQFPLKVGEDLDDIAAAMDISSLVLNGKFLQSDVSVTTTVGYLFTAYNAGTFSSGSYTPNAALGNYQYLTNGGAFSWNASAADSALDVLVTNNSSAGVITFVGFTVAAGNTGDALNTVNGNMFIVSVRRIHGVSTYVIKALQ